MNDELRAIPAKWAHPPAEMISQIPKGGTKLDYMGHADVTLALIDVDPTFTYGWVTNGDGTMAVRKPDANRLVLEGWLTVHGVTRPCVGTCEARKFEPEKELIGDLLRNGAMRFGVATGLWSKSDAHEAMDRPEPDRPQVDPVSEAWQQVLAVKGTPIVDSLKALAEQEGKKLTEVALKDETWRTQVLALIEAQTAP